MDGGQPADVCGRGSSRRQKKEKGAQIRFSYYNTNKK
jgi:hypothetical protein